MDKSSLISGFWTPAAWQQVDEENSLISVNDKYVRKLIEFTETIIQTSQNMEARSWKLEARRWERDCRSKKLEV